MVPTETATDAPARASIARKLTIARAIDQWEQTTLAIEGLTVLRKEAAEVLLAHAEKTGRRTYKDRIAVVSSGGSVVLDQARLRQFLGARLVDFQTRSKRVSVTDC